MIYGYIRVSTDKQSVINQKYEIECYCKNNKFQIAQWIEETISGTESPNKRKLGDLLNRIKKDDIIICSELSRLGRSLFMIMNVLSICLTIGAKIYTIKDGYRLGDDIQSKVLAFAFGLSAEIERNLIAQRTKEALARCKAEGKILGRRPGPLKTVKLTGHEEEIAVLLNSGKNKAEIGRYFGVHRQTVRLFIRDRMRQK